MAKHKKKRKKKKANVDHFITQLHLRKSGGQGAHKNKKKVIFRNRKHKGSDE